MKIKNLNPLYEYKENSNRFSYHVKQMAKVPLRMARNAHEEFGPDMTTAKNKAAISALGPLGAVLAKVTSDIDLKKSDSHLFNKKSINPKFNQMPGYNHDDSII